MNTMIKSFSMQEDVSEPKQTQGHQTKGKSQSIGDLSANDQEQGSLKDKLVERIQLLIEKRSKTPSTCEQCKRQEIMRLEHDAAKKHEEYNSKVPVMEYDKKPGHGTESVGYEGRTLCSHLREPTTPHNSPASAFQVKNRLKA